MSQQLTQDRKAAIRRLYDGIERGDFGVIDEVCAADFVSVEGAHQDVAGLAEFTAEVRAIHRGYGNPRFEILDLVAEGDDVVVRWRVRATHAGELFGIPATGRPVDIEAFALFRFIGHRIAARYAVTDRLGMLSQLGG